jgi:hypothetical protein
MSCGNGSDRAQHPMELFGDDWMDFEASELKPAKKDGETIS